jgi:hypothetical protein
MTPSEKLSPGFYTETIFFEPTGIGQDALIFFLS